MHGNVYSELLTKTHIKSRVISLYNYGKTFPKSQTLFLIRQNIREDCWESQFKLQTTKSEKMVQMWGKKDDFYAPSGGIGLIMHQEG